MNKNQQGNSLLVLRFSLVKKCNKILYLVLILIPSFKGFGQEVPWRYQITGIDHTIIIGEKTTIEIPDYSGAGVLGVFYDSLGLDVCAGYVDLNQDTDYLIVYGETENKNGITSGERFHFKLWDREKDCIYDNVNVAYITTDQAPNTGVFVSDGVSNITSIKASPIVVEYPTSLICPNENVMPSVIDSGRYRFVFSAEEGLSIDENTGAIDASNSVPGEYIVKVSSDYCILNPSNTFRVSYSDIRVAEQQFKCPDELLDVTEIEIESVDSWEVIDSLSNTGSLSAGQHTIQFVNSDGCVVERQIEVVNYPEQDIQLQADYNCESTTIRLAEDQDIATVEWPNDATGSSMEVYESSAIEVRYTDSNQCSRMKSVDVEVKKLQIQTLETNILPADCYLNGSIEIRSVNVENSTGDLDFEFINQLTNETYQSSERLAEGKYQIVVYDDRNCADTWPQDLVVLKDCLKDRPVFSPNNDFVDDRYYISDSGTAEVYNRNGTKVSEFETPIYWDGTDRQGRDLPMGTYLIVINNEKVINITILK